MDMVFVAQTIDEWMPLIDAKIDCHDLGCAIKITVERESDILLKVTSKSKLPANIETRIVEALRYVLAKVIHVATIQHSSGAAIETTFISAIRTSETGLFPPIRTRKSIASNDIQRLFRRYLTFVHSETSAEFVHPCSMHLRNACEASANSVEAETIGLCVAVEGIASLVPFENKTNGKVVSNIRKAVSEYLGNMGVDSTLTNRIQGLLGQLENVRVKDRVQKLIDSGHLDPSCFEAWERLRHKGVHPKRSTLEEFDDRSFQERLDDIHRVYVCMYQITFALIGYEGQFSNYASKRFRLETYPLKAPTRDVAS